MRIAWIDFMDTVNIRRLLMSYDFSGLDDWQILPRLSRWLLDARGIANAGIPPNSFTLLLESGTDADFCTEAFEQLVHPKIALKQAWDACMESGLLQNPTERAPERLSPEREMTMITRELAVGEAIQEAIIQLVNQKSTTLRCDFNPGLVKDHHIIFNEMKAHPQGLWDYWERAIDTEPILLPDYLKVRETLAHCYNIQTGDEYLQSQARDHQ